MHCLVNGQQVVCPALVQTPFHFLSVLPVLFFIIMIVIVEIVALWKIYQKAGKKGWAAIIPIYNIFVLLEIVKRPAWWILLFFIPFLNVAIPIVIMIDLARLFGKGTGFGIGLAFLNPIFIPILGFGSAQYQG